MGKLKQAALSLRRFRARPDLAGTSGQGDAAERPLFTAITDGWGAGRGGGGRGAAVDVIATFVGVLGRLEATPPANRPADSRKIIRL